MPPLTADNWAAREHRVSASEVAALMPEGHPYIDARAVYDRLSGFAQPVTVSDAMRLGTILEPAILAAAADRWGWRVITNYHTYCHRYAPLCATPDARMVRERTLVEVKYSGNPTAWANLPAHVYWQVQAQMMCTHTSRVEVVVLAGGLQRFTVARSMTAARRIAAACREMLDMVADGTPPDHVIRDYSTLNTRRSDIPESIEGHNR
jgi:hypothetical protein